MAIGKKGFILYADLLKVVEMLPDEMAGKLFKTILRYVNDLEINIDDLLLQVTFEPIKQQLKRDLEKWEKQHQQRIDAAQKSVEARRKLKESSTGVKRSSTVNGTGNSKSNSKSIEERKEVFKAQIREFASTYQNQDKEFHKFFSYWTEKNPQGRKMRWEKEKTFDLSRRLATWFDNVKDWKKPVTEQVKKQTAAEALKNKINRGNDEF